jgi:AAA15 family ATPase/GTPase
MLISFSVENFLSFKERQTLEFTPEALKEHKDHVHIPYFFDPSSRLLKSVALYGHNSHGKSNLIKAYSFFIEFIFNSFNLGRKEHAIPVEHFRLNTITANKPSYFQIIFLIRETKYRYGYQVSKHEVVEEWLYYAEPKVRENYLFHRIGKEYKINKSWNKETVNQVDKALPFIRSHSLLLSVLISQESVPKVSAIEKWLKGNLIIQDLDEKEYLQKAVLISAQSQYRRLINNFIENADLGFTSIFEKIDSQVNKAISLDKNFLSLYYNTELDNFELYTKHKVFDEHHKVVSSISFDLLKSESSGTIRFFVISCFLSFSIIEGQLILIDELDSRFHSHLLKYIVEMFNHPKVNSSGSQLIFTTHNTILLNKVLRRDQIVFVEKSDYGESTLRKLHTTDKPVRVDTPLEREYLKGKLGGVSKKLKEKTQLPDLGFE